jgi:hypothetical protein
MLTPTEAHELLDVLAVAEQAGDAAAIESAVIRLALYYVATKNPLAAVPFWRRGAELVAKSTAPNSAELAPYLHNMAAYCLIPAGLHDEARATLLRAKELYALHFRADARFVRHVDELLNEIGA